MSDITNAELARRLDAGVATFRDEIRVVHRRLDGQAQRLNDHAVKLAVHEAQATAAANRPGAPATTPTDTTAKPITRWDLTVFVAGVYLLLEVLPKIRGLLTP
ncbi:MAG: hypothetical protein AB7S57_19565 [Acetobacteraceae bacterium]